MLNRAAIILKYKAPAIDWVNEADPSPDSHPLSMEDANEERTVYLISEDDADGPEALDRWLRANFENLFEAELEDWYTDTSLWPKERTPSTPGYPAASGIHASPSTPRAKPP